MGFSSEEARSDATREQRRDRAGNIAVNWRVIKWAGRLTRASEPSGPWRERGEDSRRQEVQWKLHAVGSEVMSCTRIKLSRQEVPPRAEYGGEQALVPSHPLRREWGPEREAKPEGCRSGNRITKTRLPTWCRCRFVERELTDRTGITTSAYNN